MLSSLLEAMVGDNGKFDCKIQIWRALDEIVISFGMMNQVINWNGTQNFTPYLCVWIRLAERVK